MYRNSSSSSASSRRSSRRPSNFRGSSASAAPRRAGQYGRSNSVGNRRRGAAQNIDPRRFVKAARPVQQTEYTPDNTFEDFQLNDTVKRNLATKGFVYPTQIQDQSIPVALTGKDVVGIANTGTGKTAAFLLPLIDKLMGSRDQKVLIIAPTRELALQIQKESRDFAIGARLFDVLLIGGTPIYRQFKDLKRNPEIIIGTPGRIKDHIERATLDLSKVQSVVLDEVDRMLDMGFIGDIRMILSKLPENRQSLFYSATMSSTIEALIKTFTHSPVTIMAKTAETSDNVEQTVIHYTQSSEKVDKLQQLLGEGHVEKTLVFCETKRSVEKLSIELSSRGFLTDAMHGNKSQGQRQRALRKFRDSDIHVLVATDVAARGIDVDGITHVVNFDIPQTYDDYTHRIGRAGRGNNTGYAVTFVAGSR
jgi:superfamily II DNA/RNA helicase